MSSQQDEATPQLPAGQSSRVDRWISALDQPGDAEKLHALEILGILGTEAREAVPKLLDLMGSCEDEILDMTIKAICRIVPSSEFLSLMTTRLRGPSVGARRKALLVLNKISSRYQPIEYVHIKFNREISERLYQAALKSAEPPDPMARCLSVSLLGKLDIELEILINQLSTFLNDSCADIRAAAVDALGELAWGEVRAFLAILRHLKDETEARVWHAFGPALGNVTAFSGYFRDQSQTLADAAMPAITAGLTSSDEEICGYSLTLVDVFGESARPAVPNLVALVATDSKNRGQSESKIKLRALKALGRFGPAAQSAVPALIEARQSSDEAIREAANTSLARIDPRINAALCLDDQGSGFVPVRSRETEMPVYFGEGRCRIGTKLIRLTDTEEMTLQALVELRTSNKEELVNSSGLKDAPRILKKITEKYPDLARFISLPGKKGMGGYSTTIRPV